MGRPRTHRLKAPAKLNLFLKVIGRRPDGYHALETLFERITLHDVLTFRVADSGIRLTCTGRKLTSGRANLVYKAASLLKERYKVRNGIEIRLHKNIPVASGLGGGSSDAATTLSALNEIWRLKLSQKALLRHAAQLGSDVPFFLLRTAFAVGKGRGERLRVLKERTRFWHVLALPPLETHVKDVYSALKPRDFQKGVPADGKALLSAYEESSCRRLRACVLNTLESVLLKKIPLLRKIKEEFLEAGAEAALVSGSGPTVFAVARSKTHADQVLRRMQRKRTISLCVVSTDHG